MTDPLFELLTPYFDAHDASSRLSASHAVADAYLVHLTTLPLAALSSTEPQSLLQNSQSIVRSLQGLAKRSHKLLISSSDHLLHLRSILPCISRDMGFVQAELPALETAAQSFSDKYNRAAENTTLDRRRKAMLLSRNTDRVSDILDLPYLLSSAISSSTTAAATQATTPTALSNISSASALDLHAHIKRMQTLYPASPLVSSLAAQAEQEMKTMTTNLITSLQSQGLKLAGAMRTIGWLRRIAPELDELWTVRQSGTSSGEGSLGALFLVCRLACLQSTLQALDPLRELAGQEMERRARNITNSDVGWAAGQQTEKYLKKYLEIFREQSFAIISMYRSIFPSAMPAPESEEVATSTRPATSFDSPELIPSALATFSLHLVELLFEAIQTYLPNVQDRSARDSLLTQVLYCAGSLGRLGGDFSMMIALLEEDLRVEFASDSANHTEQPGAEEEWVEVMKKHRVQASRLELLASGVSTMRSSSASEKMQNLVK